MSIKFRVLGGGGLGGGGGSANFIFMGARIFLIFGRGAIREVFHPPSFFHPPMTSSEHLNNCTKL